MLFKFQGLQSQINSYCQFGRLKVRLVATVRSEFDCEHCHVSKYWERTLLCSHTLKGMLIFCDGVCTSRQCIIIFWMILLLPEPAKPYSFSFSFELFGRVTHHLASTIWIELSNKNVTLGDYKHWTLLIFATAEWKVLSQKWTNWL